MSPILHDLRNDLIYRQISHGLACVITGLPMDWQDESNSIEFLMEASKWIDFDPSLCRRIENCMDRWPLNQRGGLLHEQALQLRFVEAAVWMHKECFTGALHGFTEVAHALEHRVIYDPHLAVVVNFYSARCLYHLRQYEEADAAASKAYTEAAQLEDGRLQAEGVNVLRSRILLKAKPFKDVALPAQRLLENAWAAYAGSDDRVTKGKILTFRSEIAKRGPHCGESPLELSNQAVHEFEQHQANCPDHPGEALAKTRRARSLRDAALGLAERVDRELRQNIPCATLKKKIWEYQDRALKDLRRAIEIYEHWKQARGVGNSNSFAGYICLDRGDYRAALAAGLRAIEAGEEANDATALTRGALLAAAAEIAMYEDEDPSPGTDLGDTPRPRGNIPNWHILTPAKQSLGF